MNCKTIFKLYDSQVGLSKVTIFEKAIVLVRIDYRTKYRKLEMNQNTLNLLKMRTLRNIAKLSEDMNLKIHGVFNRK